jgi:tol-pal system protein YbgF
MSFIPTQRIRSSSSRPRRVRAWLRGAVLAGSCLLLPAAHAGLFDDEEARRQITNIRTQIDENQKALSNRLSQLEAAAGESRDRSVDLVQLIEALRQDVAKLRGQVEVLANQNEQLERRQKDLYVDLDNRLRKMEQANAELQQKLTQGERDANAEKQAYETALNQFKVGNYQMSITGFQSFMANYPNSTLAPSAQYWTGNAHYAMRDYKAAIAAQQKVLSAWPENQKAPDAMLNIASSQAEMGDSKAARETLAALVKRYPTSPAAEQAKQRLVRR